MPNAISRLARQASLPMGTSMLRYPLLVAATLALIACSSSTETAKLPAGRECGGQNERCLSGQCHVIDSGTSVCTQNCASNDDCPGTMLCDRVPVAGSICLPTGLGGRCVDDTECPAGHRCDEESSRCYIPVVRDLCAPCTSSKQCPAGGHCATVEVTGERYCTTGCEAQDDCPSGFLCLNVDGASGKQCVPANETKTCSAGKGLCSPCRGDSECGEFDDLCVRNLASNERFCGTSCTRNTDCPEGFGCTDLSGEGHGPFQCTPNSGTCAGYCESDDPEVVRRQCGNGASCDVDARVCEAATDGRQCAACEDDDGCPGGGSRCVVNNCEDCPYAGQKFCATSCADAGGQKDDAMCAPGFFCAELGTSQEGASGLWHCVPNTGTCRGGAGELGDDCTGQGAISCKSGLCLGFGAQSLCSTSCAADEDCGDGRFRCCALTEDGESFDCTEAPGPQGGVCSPRGGAFGADCSPGLPPCFSGACLDMGSARLCTTECDGNSCPDGFSCRIGQRAKGDGSFENVSICFPDGGGEIGADCKFGPAACASGYCIKKPSGNVCTVTCADDPSVCPQDWFCDKKETVDGEQVSVCLPDDLK